MYVLRYRFEGRAGWTVHARGEAPGVEAFWNEHARDLARLPGRAEHPSLEVEVLDGDGARRLSSRFYVDEPLCQAADHSIGAAETADPDLLAALPPEKAEELRARLRAKRKPEPEVVFPLKKGLELLTPAENLWMDRIWEAAHDALPDWEVVVRPMGATNRVFLVDVRFGGFGGPELRKAIGLHEARVPDVLKAWVRDLVGRARAALSNSAAPAGG